MPKRGAFALGLTAAALVLLLNFQTPSVAPATATEPDLARTGEATGSSGTATGATGDGGPSATDGTIDTSTGQRTVDGAVVSTRFGTVQVEVTLDGTTIVDVEALQLPNGDRRTNQISSYAEPILRTQVLQVQAASIDGISGATYTSEAYARSLQSALDNAGI